MIRFLLTISFFLISVLNLAAQNSKATYKTIKVNGKTHTFKTSLEKNYPYDVDLVTVTGDTLNSSILFKQNGKPTVLLFWLTSCVPCSYLMKGIHEKYEGWQKEADFNFYAISIDPQKYADRISSHAERYKWQFEVYHDFNRDFTRIMPEGGLNGLPQTFLLNKNGKIVYHKRKYGMGDEDILFEEIQILLIED